MRVLEARVVDFDSALPRISLLVDTIPSEGFVFQKKDSYYWAHKDGLIRAYQYTGPGKGSNGVSFEILLEDGTPKVLTGPYPVDVARTNRHFRPMGVQVILADDYSLYDRGAGYDAAVTVDVALEALALAAGDRGLGPSITWSLILHYDTASGEMYFLPVLESRGKPRVLYSNEAVGFSQGFSPTLGAVVNDLAYRADQMAQKMRVHGLPMHYASEFLKLSADFTQLSYSLVDAREETKRKASTSHVQVKHTPPPSKPLQSHSLVEMDFGPTEAKLMDPLSSDPADLDATIPNKEDSDA